MKIIDYANAKYTRGNVLESFKKRYEGFDLNATTNDFLENLMKSGNFRLIEMGLRIIGELGISESGIEGKLLEYASGLISDPELFIDNLGKQELLESIIWVLGDIGTLNSMVFIKAVLNVSHQFKEDPKNFNHLMSAAGYSYFHIQKREMGNFFKLKNQIYLEPVKQPHEIDALKKLNPKYAEYEQFIKDNQSEYTGGKLN